MLLVLVIVFLVGCFTVQAKTKQPALRFGETLDDYVQLPAGIMDNATSQFTVCSWIKKRFRAKYPILFHYQPDSDDIILSDNGHYNWVGLSVIRVEDKFTVPDGEWFHACWSWGNMDYTTRVYLNGEMVGSVETEHRELHRGGRACLGNAAFQPKHTDNIFGGDLYKFNIYNRVLEQAEIRIMATHMCTSPEERSMILTWDDVLKNERTGNVTESQAVGEIACDTEKRLVLIEERFNDTREELEKKLNSTQKDLERVNKDLTVRLDDMTAKLKKSERLYLILTIVLGALSAALIILLTILLVKRVSGNRTTEIVDTGKLAPRYEITDRAGDPDSVLLRSELEQV